MEARLAKRAAPNPRVTYAVAIVAPIAAFFIRLPLASVLEDKVPYITFFLATVVSASFGGLGPGLLTTAIGAFLAADYIISPVGSIVFTDSYDYLGLAIFLAVSSFISYICGRLLDSRRHEHVLRQLFQQTLVSIGDAVISIDTEKRIRFMNRLAEEMTGWREKDAKDKPIHEVFRIVREGSNSPAEIPLDKVFETGNIVGLMNHTELITKDGRRIPIDDSVSPIKDDDGQLVGAVLVFRDITERRRTELALEAAEKRSRTILESITEAFVLLDRNWRFTVVNRAAETLFNTPASELLGKDHWKLYPRSLGTPVETFFRKAMSDGIPVHFENHYKPWDRWFEINAYPSAEGLAVYTRDITDRKRSEAALRRLNEDLTHFTFAATHDIREPLRMMTVYVQLLQRKLGPLIDSEAQTFVEHVVNGGQRISRLIDALLQFTRMGEVDEAAPASGNAEVAFIEALEDLQITIRETGAKVDHDPLPSVKADHTALSQLFQNLISNAIKYRKNDISPEIQISAARDGDKWIFSVTDNGIGIASEHFEQIFVPFKRLHGADVAGTGIGLATCKRIVERYGGRIWVESEPQNGSTFRFTLEAAEDVADAND